MARDAAVPRSTLQAYLEILEHTLLTFRLEAYRPRLRVKEVAHPKLYWADAGLVRAFKRNLGPVAPEERGSLFEGWVAQTLRAMNDYRGLFDDWHYWSSHASGGAVEVDFLLRRGKRRVAIEAKAGGRFKPEMLKGLQAIGALPGVERRILVYGGADSCPPTTASRSCRCGASSMKSTAAYDVTRTAPRPPTAGARRQVGGAPCPS